MFAPVAAVAVAEGSMIAPVAAHGAVHRREVMGTDVVKYDMDCCLLVKEFEDDCYKNYLPCCWCWWCCCDER